MLVLAVLGIGGCATASRQRTFLDVSREVEHRVGETTTWRAAGGDDQGMLNARVDALLARELEATGAVEIALLRQPDLQAAFEELGVARGELLQAGLVRNPAFEGEFRFLSGGPGHTAELNLVQDVIDLAYRGARRRIGKAALGAAKARAVAAAIDVAAQAREAWYRAVAEEQLLAMRKTVLEAVGASYEVARRLHLAGNIHDVDLSQEQALYEQARLDVTASEAARTAAREELAAALGLLGGQAVVRLPEVLPDPPAEDPDLADLEVKALELSLDLEAARRDREAAGRERAMVRSMGSVPRLGLGVSAEREDTGHWGLGPAVNLGLPLFDRGQGRAEVAAARMRQAEAAQEGLGIRIRALVRANGVRLAGARERVGHFQKVILPLRDQIVEQMQLRYNAMAVSVFQLLAAKREQIMAGQQYVQALRDYWLARVSIDALGQGRARSAGTGPELGATGGSGEAGEGAH